MQLEFHNFQSLVRYISSLKQKGIKIKSVTRTANIIWMQCLTNARFRREKDIITILACQAEIDSMLNSINVESECETAVSKAVTALSTPSKIKLNPKLINRTFGIMDKELRLKHRKFNVTTSSQAFDLSTKNTSSSFPDYITPKGANFHKCWNDVDKMISSKSLHKLNDHPISTSWRVQVNREQKLKMRIFYPVPQIITVSEIKLFGNFVKHFDHNKNTPYVFSNTYEDLRKRFIHLQKSKQSVGLDYSGFDQSISNDLVNLLFRYLRSHLNLNKRDEELFQSVVSYHLNAKLFFRSQDGKSKVILFSKKKGLLSGSYLTNFLGSMINLFIIYYTSLELYSDIPLSVNVHGDDCLFSASRGSIEFDMSRMISSIDKNFKMTISKEKSETFSQGQRVYFLGHFFDTNGRYINYDRINKQLSISENFIPEERMTKEVRILSKIYSLLSKCSDGKDFFDTISQKILNVLNIQKFPDFYYQMFSIGKDYELVSTKNVWEAWRIQ